MFAVAVLITVLAQPVDAAGAASNPAVSGQTSPTGKRSNEADPSATGSLSPLNAYLGFDPLTGEDLPPARRMALQPAAGEIRKPIDPDDPAAMLDLVEEGLANIQQGDLLGPLGLAGGRPDWMVSLQRAAVVISLLFLIWPISIAVGEWLAWLRRRRDLDRTDGERRYDRQRMTLRLLSAFAIAAAIGLTAWGCSLAPGAVTAGEIAVAAAGPIVAGVLASALRGQVTRLDRDQLLQTLREVRRDQRELRRDLDELHRRLGRVDRVGTTAGV